MRIALRLSLLLLVLGAVPGAALAQERNVPPGNSEIDQYVESVPGADGDRGVGTTPPRRRNRALSGRTRRELDALGPDGKAAARLAESNAPARARRAGGGDQRDVKGEGSGADAVVDAVTGSSSDGLGVFLPIGLAAIAAVAVGLAVRRRLA